MGKISILKPEVIEKIAAGEVIERPASVVKELVENSIDAQASHIRVDFSEYGSKLIRVTDNGSGMDSDDLEASIKRHATSKIKDAEDLANVLTFGFRGEALSAISSVSNITVVSKTADMGHALKIKASAGNITEKDQIQRSAGTTIEVENLFFNTPVRFKFLKTRQTEKSHIISVFEELALANPDIAFELYENNAQIYKLSPTQNLLERISEILSSSTAGNLMPIEIDHLFIRIYGYITKPAYKENTRTKNYIFINKRPITSRILNFAVSDAFRPYLPPGIYPVGILFLDINTELVDINVHPAKREIRLSKEREIFGILKEAIQNAIQNSIMPRLNNLKSDTDYIMSKDLPADSVELRQKIAIEKSIYKYLSSHSKKDMHPANQFHAKNQSFAGHISSASPESQVRTKTAEQDSGRFDININLEDAKILGQFNKLYIVAEWGDNLIVVDQHAAQERVLYEQMLKQSENGVIETQELIIPFTFDTQQSEFEILSKYSDEIRKLGIEIEPFGGKNFVVKAVPAVFGKLAELKSFISQIIEQLIFFEESMEKNINSTPQLKEKIIMASCKGAVKANQELSKEEIKRLFSDLALCKNPYTCPHGRPTLIRINSEELAKRFDRK